MYACVHTYIHVCTYQDAYRLASTPIAATLRHVCMHVCIYIYTHMCMYIYTYTHTHTYIYTYISTHIYVCGSGDTHRLAPTPIAATFAPFIHTPAYMYVLYIYYIIYIIYIYIISYIYLYIVHIYYIKYVYKLSVCFCVYVCQQCINVLCILAPTCIHTCIYVYIYTHKISIYIHPQNYLNYLARTFEGHVCVCVYVCMFLCVCIHACIYVHMYTPTPTCC